MPYFHSMETKTAIVRKALVHKITVIIDRLNRRAVKLGVPPIVYEVGMSRVELIKDTASGEEFAAEVCTVTFTLNIPQLADWEFVCTIQHLDGVNLLMTVPGKESVDLISFRTCAPGCSHCNLYRNRSDTYVVRNVTTGELKQVGKNCLADFTGYGKSPEDAAAYAEWLTSLSSFFSDVSSGDGDFDSEGYCGEKREGFGLDRFLSYVTACSRLHGFRSGKQAQETQCNSTKQDALYHMEPPQGARLGKLINPTEEDCQFAKQAREWAAGLNPISDFDHNLKAIANLDGCLYRNAGIAAYIVQAYRKYLGEEAKRKSLPVSKHFGAEKERLRGIKLIYLGNASFDSQFGITFIHRFRTMEGSDAIWKTGDCGSFTEGETYSVDATVKSHGNYKGRDQTVINRVKVL